MCAVALEFLNTIEDEDLFENVRERGAEIKEGLEKLQARFDFIREVRGEGLILGLDLSIEGGPIVEEALRQGLIINCTHEHILRFLPPFIIRTRQVREFLNIFSKALAKAPHKKWTGAQSMQPHDTDRDGGAAEAQVQAVAR